jgi:hypothetical protein
LAAFQKRKPNIFFLVSEGVEALDVSDRNVPAKRGRRSGTCDGCVSVVQTLASLST